MGKRGLIGRDDGRGMGMWVCTRGVKKTKKNKRGWKKGLGTRGGQNGRKK